MAPWQDRIEALRTELFEERKHGVHERVHQLVAGRSWILVGKGGKRFWVVFYEHRDSNSLRAYEQSTGNMLVLQRSHVLDIRTLSTDDLQFTLPECHRPHIHA